MAIFHFSAKVISRANGSSALAAAAYRSASRLHDQRLDRHHDFSNKAGVVHSEVLLPDTAPEHLSDRERLWNAVELAEKRIDAQLAREIEFALPRELDAAEGISLARKFVGSEFVSRGMVADLNVHWDIGAHLEPKPHAHVMLTMREVTKDGFGAKVRDWNGTGLLEHWREAWAGHVNQRLAELDIDTRVDHRSLEAQGIDLEPQHKIGPAAGRMAERGLSRERVDEHGAIARANGDKLLTNPALALDAITYQQATFTTRDLAMFVHRHSADKDQFDRIMAAVRAVPELVALGEDGRGNQRFSSRAMLQIEQRLERAAISLEARRNHAVQDRHQQRAVARAAARGVVLSNEQQSAFEHVTNARGLSVVIGYAGSGKSAMLGVARDAWGAAGYRVQGAALSGIAAENLQAGSGMEARTIASLEHQWAQGRELLSPNDVLVIDEAGMIGSRQMERVISEAEKRGAKLALVGDPEQLQAIEAGAAFRSIAERHGAIEITDIRRQREEWQRRATRQLATGRTAEAIAGYDQAGHVHVAETREQARAELIERWDADRTPDPSASRLILTHTNEEVQALNSLARERLREAGELGDEVTVRTERGSREFASGDRIMFLKNERSLGVKNGSLGSVESVSSARMSVLLDDGRSVAFDLKNERSLGVKNGSLGSVESVSSARMSVLLDDGRSVAFDLKDYAQLDHGYAATIHKAQGVTVDKVHVLATSGMDRHAAYVALSRHRDGMDLHYGRVDFADHDRLVAALSRERGKDMASDYVREFADRRAIILPTPTGPARQLDMFEGLAISPAKEPALAPRKLSLHEAVVRFAKATAEIVRRRQQGFDATPEQEVHFQSARRALDEIRPGAARDLRAAFVRDIALIDEAAAGNTGPVIGAMDWESRYRADPQFRADDFVKTWRQLGDRHELFERRGDEAAARRIAGQMTVFAKTLERDPQVESLLRNRNADLGLPPHIERPLSQALPNWIGWGRGRGLER